MAANAKGAWESIKKYLREVRAELRKVNWPNVQELVSYTTVVLVAVFVVAAFIGVVDLIFSSVIARVILRQGG